MSILLLQGPLGPFFNKLQSALIDEGKDVHRIILNGGDQLYSSGRVTAYTGSQRNWHAFLLDFIRVNNIQTILAFGDCRAYHIDAKRICIQQNIRYFALEEGYLRPNYITVEEGGVNGYSPITHEAISLYEPMHTAKDESPIPNNLFRRFVYGSLYYTFGFFNRLKFKGYRHHRSFSSIYESCCWVRSYIRKNIYRVTEPKTRALISNGEFFLVPLQVHNDAQIEFHSPYKKIEDFIEEVMVSFSNSGSNARLVFKHHPMDRGHTNYKKIIAKKAAELNLTCRIEYIHDQHLPTLLKACKGVVTINSTTALQAFYHRAPVKVLGDAFFDMPGLTCVKPLNEFWLDPGVSNETFTDQFKAYLLDHGQINGSFYTEFDMTINNLIAHLKKLRAI